MKIQIEGMSCDACVTRVRRTLSKIPDVRVKEVSIGSAEIELSPERLDEALRAIEKVGYQPHIPA
jgi:copper chaperone CopZ